MKLEKVKDGGFCSSFKGSTGHHQNHEDRTLVRFHALRDHFHQALIGIQTAIQPLGRRSRDRLRRWPRGRERRGIGVEEVMGERIFCPAAVLDCPSGGYLKADWLEFSSGKDY